MCRNPCSIARGVMGFDARGLRANGEQDVTLLWMALHRPIILIRVTGLPKCHCFSELTAPSNVAFLRPRHHNSCVPRT